MHVWSPCLYIAAGAHHYSSHDPQLLRREKVLVLLKRPIIARSPNPLVVARPLVSLDPRPPSRSGLVLLPCTINPTYRLSAVVKVTRAAAMDVDHSQRHEPYPAVLVPNTTVSYPPSEELPLRVRRRLSDRGSASGSRSLSDPGLRTLNDGRGLSHNLAIEMAPHAVQQQPVQGDLNPANQLALTATSPVQGDLNPAAQIALHTPLPSAASGPISFAPL